MAKIEIDSEARALLRQTPDGREFLRLLDHGDELPQASTFGGNMAGIRDNLCDMWDTFLGR